MNNSQCYNSFFSPHSSFSFRYQKGNQITKASYSFTNFIRTDTDENTKVVKIESIQDKISSVTFVSRKKYAGILIQCFVHSFTLLNSIQPKAQKWLVHVFCFYDLPLHCFLFARHGIYR